MPLLGPQLVDVGSIRAGAAVIYDGSGNILTTLAGTPPANATLTQVALSTVSVTILAANANRRQAIIVNQTNKILNISYNATASLTVFTAQIAPNQLWTTPAGGYTGIITGIWLSAGSGNAIVTEVTP